MHPYAKVWRGDALVSLAREHIAEDAEEQARVLASGGEVRRTQDGKLRVQGVIQVTAHSGAPSP